MYQVLARKYRPRNFNELVGQNHVSRALSSALERGRLHHAYLFTGTRGVGKTTIARILAKCLNCETGVTATPCEVCPTCTAVNEGRFIDLIEIDAASRTKVEDTRELLDNVPYAPTQGRFKVYLIDEVHMLSTHSFNALLKTLEEPPEHVKFLFATTDPQKLPITVISRCLQFSLRPLAVDEITQHLSLVLSQENIAAEQDAIWQIAESAQGSVRDAMSLTDQAIAYGQGEIKHQDVKEMLGLIDRSIIYDLILAIHQNQKALVSQLLLQFRQQALDVSMVMDQLIATLHELALLQYLPDLALKYSAEINAKIMQLAAQISAMDLQLYYQIACKGRAELQMAISQEQGFEMTVLRLLAFRPLQAHEIPQAQPTAASPQSVPAEAAVASAAPVISHPESSASHSDVEDDFYADDFADHAAVDPMPAADEPSSDDYLDEDFASDHIGTLAAEANTHVEAAALDLEAVPETDLSTAQSHLTTDVASEHTAATGMLFDAAETGLFELEVASTVPVSPTQPQASTSDDVIHDFSTPVELTLESTAQIEALEPQADLLSATELVAADVTTDETHLMPQDILKVPEPELLGEWTVEKWEYWFRSSQLSPAVQELAQYGLMQGEIDGSSTFVIPKQYEQLLTQLQHVLEAALKTAFPLTHLQVKFDDVSEVTPYQLQHLRRDKAMQRAQQLLQQEPIIQALQQGFDASLQHIELKQS